MVEGGSMDGGGYMMVQKSPMTPAVERWGVSEVSFFFVVWFAFGLRWVGLDFSGGGGAGERREERGEVRWE